jgi:hypothetical protein
MKAMPVETQEESDLMHINVTDIKACSESCHFSEEKSPNPGKPAIVISSPQFKELKAK